MALASVSAATFWGDIFLFLGSALTLFGLMKAGMTERWTKRTTSFGAISLLVGAAISIYHDVGAYRDKHHAQAALAFVALVGVIAFALLSFLRADEAKRVPGEEGEADGEEGASVGPHTPAGERSHDIESD